ncbi:MAG: DUF58 domain-containing protein, partial [Bacteroidetes bacterium]
MSEKTSDILKKVRRIELKTRGISNALFSGEYHSAFKGRGMAFSEVREYQPGDDIRTIDWNVTARFSNPYVKIFEEERELTVMLLIDMSASDSFGTDSQLKKELITELAAVLAVSAIQNNDKVGVILFTDRVEKFIPPKKGKSHILRIIRELLGFEPEHKKTDVGEAVKYFYNAIKKRSIGFIISDFLTGDFTDELKMANRRHDVIALQIYDRRELELPKMGFVQFADPETGEVSWVNTNRKKLRDGYATNAANHNKRI